MKASSFRLQVSSHFKKLFPSPCLLFAAFIYFKKLAACNLQFATNKKGFTLIELVITVVLIGIVLFIVANSLYTGINAYLTTDKRKESLDQARIAMERMTREIRLVNAIVNGASVVPDVSIANATTFSFTDVTGAALSFTLETGNIKRTSGATTVILANGVSSIGDSVFATGIFSYIINGSPTPTQTPAIPQIKRIMMGFKTTTDNESIQLKSEVWPRSL